MDVMASPAAWHSLMQILELTKTFLLKSHAWIEPSSQPAARRLPSREVVNEVGIARNPPWVLERITCSCFRATSGRDHIRIVPSLEQVIKRSFSLGCQQP